MNIDIIRAGARALDAPDSAAAARACSRYFNCFRGIVGARCCASCTSASASSRRSVRPLVWLFIFAAGFRQVLGVSIIPPYETYVLYEVYVVPGLVGMILLFNAMQSSLSMVYDRETGAMRTLLVESVSALVPAAFEARWRRRRGRDPGLRVSRHLLFLGSRHPDVTRCLLSRADAAEGLAISGQLLLLAIPAPFSPPPYLQLGNGHAVSADACHAPHVDGRYRARIAVLVGAVFFWQLAAPSMNYVTVFPALLLARPDARRRSRSSCRRSSSSSRTSRAS